MFEPELYPHGTSLATSAKAMRLYTFLVAFILNFSCAKALASIEPGNSKAFKIHYGGKTSYILGTSRHFDVHTFQIPKKILEGLDQVDEVIFETDRFDDHGELLPDPEPDISIEKITKSEPIKLFPQKKSTAQTLFATSDLKPFYDRLSPGLFYFFARRFADEIISNNVTKVTEAFAAENIKPNGHFPDIKLSSSHREAAEQLLGSDLYNEEIFDHALRYFMKKSKTRATNSGIDSEIYREARKRGLNISGLQNTEPYSDSIEATSAFITESDVNRVLAQLKNLIDEKKAIQNWFNIIHSNYLTEHLHLRYFEIDNRKFFRLSDLVTAFPAPGPGEYQLKNYEQNRHQYWVPELLRKLETSRLFIAVGASHVMGSKTSKNLLEQLREKGAVVEPIIVCDIFLKSRNQW